MAFDIDGFLKDLGTNEEESKTLRTALGTPERLSLLEKNQLRQADYSKQSNALKDEQQKLTLAQDRLNAEAAEWATLSANERAQATTLRDSLNASEQKVLALQQRVQKVAVDAGLDPQKALEGIEQVVKKEEPKVAPIDTSKFVDAATFGSMSEYLFNLSVELPQIAAEHFELTGERLDTRAIRAEITERSKQKNANLDPRAIWEEKFQIPQKREAKDTAARAEEIKQAELRGAERARSEFTLPTAPTSGINSPLLKATTGEEHKSVLHRPAPESGVRSAAAALSSGKYRQQPAAAGTR